MYFMNLKAAHSTHSPSKNISQSPDSTQSSCSKTEAELLKSARDVMNDTSKQPEPAEGQAKDRAVESTVKQANLLKGKQKEWATRKKDGPLELLDLPLDILKCIVKEVTHTNDLTSLALTNSALNFLAIPHIYSRFDIVWPDAHSSSEPRSGVDALTYGLATLVMREDLFGYMPPHSGGPGQSSCLGYTCNHCGMANDVSVESLKPKDEIRRPRRGNLFSQYTRKFSLGNGPTDWVQEYLISKEGGKMLGTLIALTIARMPNLETLTWDMPTGIVREVWHALASLGECRPGHHSRLEKVWVRLHDNREVIGVLPVTSNPLSSHSAAIVPSLPLKSSPFSADVMNLNMSYDRVEHPNFSILPALKSLSVLEIDELAYLKEMSVLVHRSRDSLRELRIGLSTYCASVIIASVTIKSDRSDHQCRAIGCYSDGGVLGLVMNEIYDCRKASKAPRTAMETPTDPKASEDEAHKIQNAMSSSLLAQPFSMLAVTDDFDNGVAASIKLPDSPEGGDTASLGVLLVNRASPPPSVPIPSPPHLPPSLFDSAPSEDPRKQRQPADRGPGLQVVNSSYSESESLPALGANGDQGLATSSSCTSQIDDPHQRPLRLETLELEKMPLSVTVLQKTIDWSALTALTLLDCVDHERLWKVLRRTYSPRSTSLIGTSSLGSLTRQPSQPHLRRVSSSRFDTHPAPEYRLNLKRIHTDTVSPALISFLKETLAPNTLEWLLLQEHGQYVSPVTVGAIYRGPLRHHRSSLKKVLIDSSDSPPEHRTRSNKWKKWMLNRDILTFVTSGKMGCLRELGMALDYKDWHFFLQRLPNIPQLRSLYIPHIANHVYDHHLDAKELALQIVDLVIVLRPEIELCYMGILTKCFEILENRSHGDSRLSYHDSRTNTAHAGPGGVGDSDADSDETDDNHDDDDDDDDDDSDNGPPVATTSSADSEDADSEAGVDSAGNTDDELAGGGKGRKAPRFRLREILFYDDKISIFKARHGRL